LAFVKPQLTGTPGFSLHRLEIRPLVLLFLIPRLEEPEKCCPGLFGGDLLKIKSVKN
jgi:hypothetical protein